MTRIFVLAVMFMLSLCGKPMDAYAAKRVALVIGNSSYQHAAPLKNPQNDAAALADHLKDLDFEVVLGIDLTHRGFADTISKFKHKLSYADVALFFYAGHGLQVNGYNYLAPIDARLDDETSLDFEAVRLMTIMKLLENRSRTSLVFLDACRDNPLARNLARGMGTRSNKVGRGLARVESGVGTLIAFATQPGNVALDGNERHSPFAKALIRHIGTPSITISNLMIKIRRQVIAETGGKQVPWEHSSLTAPFTFKPLSEKAGNLAASNTVPMEHKSPAIAKQPAWAAFEKAQQINTCGAYKAFEEAYPESFHGKLAWEWRKKNCKKLEKVANLQGSLTDSDLSPIQGKQDLKALTEALQRELNRVGCNAGSVDGDWGSKGKSALREFNRHSGFTVSTEAPTPEALQAVMSRKVRVCSKVPATRKIVNIKPRAPVASNKPNSNKKPTDYEKARAYRENYCRSRGYSYGDLYTCVAY